MPVVMACRVEQVGATAEPESLPHADVPLAATKPNQEWKNPTQRAYCH